MWKIKRDKKEIAVRDETQIKLRKTETGEGSEGRRREKGKGWEAGEWEEERRGKKKIFINKQIKAEALQIERRGVWEAETVRGKNEER